MQRGKERRCEVDCDTNRLTHPSTCTFYGQWTHMSMLIGRDIIGSFTG